MATFLSTFAQKQADAKGAKTNGYPNASEVQRQRKIARFKYTVTGTEAATDLIQLGTLGQKGARVDVENTKLRFSGGGAFSGSVKLQRIRAGSATDLSTALATTAAAVGALTDAGIAPPTDAEPDDIFALNITAKTTFTAGKVIDVEMPYDVPTL